MSRSTEPATRPRRADCAWCGAEFANIVELLTHVEHLHLDDEALVAA